MCLPLPWGKFVLFCCRNGSFVQFGSTQTWSERSPLCPPLAGEVEDGNGSEKFVMWSVVAALLFLGAVIAAVLKKK